MTITSDRKRESSLNSRPFSFAKGDRIAKQPKTENPTVSWHEAIAYAVARAYETGRHQTLRRAKYPFRPGQWLVITDLSEDD